MLRQSAARAGIAPFHAPDHRLTFSKYFFTLDHRLGRALKIAYVLNTYPQPSQSFIRREIHALERQGFEVARLAMRRPDGPLDDPRNQAEQDAATYILDRGALGLGKALLRETLRAPGKMTEGLKMAVKLGRRSQVGVLRHLIYLGEAAEIAGMARAEGYRHLHAHFGTNPAAVALLTHVLTGIPYSFTVHGPEEFDSPEALSLGIKMDNAAFAVGVSQFGVGQLSRWAALPTWARLHVVHCGIEPERYETATPMPESDRLELVVIGRFVEQKGQMLLVRAMQELSDLDVHLTLVGDGPMRPDLEAAIAEAGLGDRITLTGWIDEAGVEAALVRSHAMAMPSLAEGLPMVAMEAMAMGRPVIGTYIAGFPELVLPGENGWLVPAGDVLAFAEAIRDLAATPQDRRVEMGLAGRERALARHDINDQAARLARLIKGD
jgi:glycosyltransferase involved in cell wall biosynthesis